MLPVPLFNNHTSLVDNAACNRIDICHLSPTYSCLREAADGQLGTSSEPTDACLSRSESGWASNDATIDSLWDKLVERLVNATAAIWSNHVGLQVYVLSQRTNIHINIRANSANYLL